MDHSERFVGSVDVIPPAKLSPVERMEFNIQDFASLPHKRGEMLSSPPIVSHGYTWCLDIYPRGSQKSDAKSEHVSIHLVLARHGSCRAHFSISLGTRTKNKNRVFHRDDACGFENFIRRSDLLAASTAIQPGVLVVTVRLRVETPALWRPKKPTFPHFLAELQRCEELFDFTFVVDGELFYAHRLVLTVRAPYLLELAPEKGTKVELPGVPNEHFKELLNYIYTDELPTGVYDELDPMLQLFELADRLSCTKLKLELESKIVEGLLDESNAVRLLLFADSHTCALLYESAIALICGQGSAIYSLPDWVEIEQSAKLASKVALQAISDPLESKSDGSFESLDISGQRRKLDEMGEDVDGSREALIRRFKVAKHRNEDSGKETTSDGA